MKKRKMFIPALFAIVLVFGLILPASVAGASATMHLPNDHSIISAVDSPSLASAMALNTTQGQATPMVAAGFYHTVGLKDDGTVVAVGENLYGQCDADSWEDIVQLAAGSQHTVGLKADGTVVAVGDNTSGQCNVGNWTDIVMVAAGVQHTVGIKANGRVVAVGYSSAGQSDVGDWG